jgi:ubiquinone/menaquinone biosynthesis C-methylase UbiE
MAHETRAANGTALELLELEPADRVLEVGFGHGATIARLSGVLSSGFVAGVDPSAEMCRMAARRNRQTVLDGRVDLRQASVDVLPYPTGAFDKALSVHTLYFWPDLVRAFREIARVLRPGGRLVLAHRTDPGAARDFPASVYRFPGDVEVQDALTRAGFACGDAIQRSFGHATVSSCVARR